MQHPFMAMSIDECVEKTHMKNKITAIIPSSGSNLKFLMWSVFSFLLRSEINGLLEHICVCLNGPDERTGDPMVQNNKQNFLEELRDIEWYQADNPSLKRGMPLTVIRAWSRVGWSEPMSMALNWIHTDSYLLCHDDVILEKPDWEVEVKEKFYENSEVAIAHHGDLLGCNCDHAIHKGMYLLRLPQMETTFIICKKKDIMKVGANWVGYHIPSDDNFLQFDINELEDLDGFMEFWIEKGLIKEPLMTTELYNFVRQEVGAWIYYKLTTNGYKFTQLSDDLVTHFGGMSRNWEPGFSENEKNKLELHKESIENLEKEIDKHPDFSRLYQKYYQ